MNKLMITEELEDYFINFECTTNIGNIFKFNENSGEIVIKTFNDSVIEALNISEILKYQHVFEESSKKRVSGFKFIGFLLGAQKYTDKDILKTTRFIDSLGIRITTNRKPNDYIDSLIIKEQTNVASWIEEYFDWYIEIMEFLNDYFDYLYYKKSSL